MALDKISVWVCSDGKYLKFNGIIKSRSMLSTLIYIILLAHLYISSWMFEKVAPKNFAILTGKTLKLRFYDSYQPQNRTKKDREGKEESGGKKRLVTLILFGEKVNLIDLQ